MKKTIKKIISITLAIAMIVSSLTYYHSTDIKADAPDYSGLTYAAIANNQNAEFDQKLYNAEVAVASGTVNFNVKQFQGVGFGDLYMALGGKYPQSATLNGVSTTVRFAADQLFIDNAASALTNYEYNVIDVTFNDSSTAKIIIHLPSNQGAGTYDGSGGETTTETESVSESESQLTPSSDPYATQIWKTASQAAYRVCIVGKNTTQEFNGTFEVQGENLYIAGSAQIIAANYKSATLNGNDLTIWEGAFVRVPIAQLTNNFDNELVIVDRNDNSHTVIIRAGRPPYEEVDPIDPETITITPNNTQITDKHKIWANWTNPEGTYRAYAYIGSVAEANGAYYSAAGWDFNTQAAQPMTGVDNVDRTHGDSTLFQPLETYTFIVVAYNVFGDLIGQGSVDITIPEYNEEEEKAAEAKKKINTAENLALRQTPFVSAGDTREQGKAAIVDGNAGSRWQAYPLGSGANQDPAPYFGVDLGERKTLGSVLVCWEASNARAYYVQLSDDGENYHTVATVSGLDNNKAVDRVSEFASEQARYVKIVPYEYSDNARSYGVSTYELAVFAGEESYTQVSDNTWVDVGIFNIYSSWTTRKSAYLGTGTEDDMHVKFIGAHTAEWDSQFGIDVPNLTSGVEYSYSISFTSNKAGTMYMQVPGSAGVTRLDDVAVVAGDNTITGTFTAGTNPAHGQIMFFPEGMADGTIFSFSDVTVEVTPQKAAPSGFTVAYTNDQGDIVFNWTASQDYTTANLYVDDNLYAGGPITNGQVINVVAFGHAEHTYKIEGITEDSYRVTERTAGVTLGMVPQKEAPEFTATYTNNNEDVLINWSAESAITSANLYVDGVAYEDNPIDRGDTISVSDIGEGIHYFSIVGKTSDIYGITEQSENVYLYDYDASLTYQGNKTGGLFPDSRDGVGNNYSRFHDTSASASISNNTAGNAIDTTANSMWSSGGHQGLDNPQFICVDFGKVRPVSEIDVWWEGANARVYKIQTSNDNENWVDVAYLSTTSAEQARIDLINFYNEKNCRYVKIYCQVQSNGYGYGIYDIGIYGSDSDSYIDPVPSNLTVTHTYGLEAKDDYLTIDFDCGYGSDATYNVYVEFPDDGHDPFEKIGTITASGSRIYGTDSFKIANRPGANQNNQIKITSVYNGVESDFSNTYTLHYERETLSSTALGTFTPSYKAVGEIAAFPSTKNDGELNDYTDYAYSRSSSSSGTAANTIDDNVETQLGSSASDPQWVEVDLREEYQIKEFDLLWNEAKASDYYIQVSTDGENYTNAYIVRNALVKDSEDGTKNQRVDNIVLNQMVTARYVRFYGTARDITNQYEYNIREFAIYGPEADKSGPDMTDNHEYTPIPTSDDPAVIDNLDWTKLGNLSSNGATAYMRTSDYNTIVSDFARYCLAGTDIDGAGIRTYHLVNGTDHMYDNNYLTMGIKNGLKFAQIEEISINDLTYIVPRDSENEKVYIKSNCLYFDESVIGAEPGEINYYVVDLGAKSEIAPFLIKVVGADIFTYTIGGDGETPVTYSDAPGDNVYDYTGQGGYGFSFAQVNNGFYKTKTIGNNTYANYLRYKNVSVTGTSNKQSADGAIDSTDNIYGNAGSRWESDWVSPYSDGEGITIDLGAVYDVSAFDILWERANAKNYNIQVSEDGETWKEVFKATKLNANYVSQDTTLSDRVDSIKLLSDTKARYVKITGTTKNLTNVGEYGYSIWDVAVYGPTSPSYVDNVYAEYLRDEVVYTRWEEVFGADNYVTTLYDSNGDVIAATTKGSAELASVIDAKNLEEGTYTVKVESYKGNTKLGEGTKTFTVDRPQSTDIIHENAGVGTYQGGTDQSGATLSYEVQIKEVHGAQIASDLGLNIAYLTDGSTDVLNVAYNYDLNNVKQAVAFVNGKQMTAEDGVLNWEDQLLKINESKIPENTITKYDIYLTIAHVQIVVNKGETAKSQKAEIFENPVDLTVQTGNDYTFSGSAGGSNVTYQWQYQDLLGEWTDIEGATTASVSGVAKMAINGRKFRFIAQAHDNNGKNYGSPVTSQAATLTVTPRQVTGLELNNDAGEVIAQWPAVDEATGYTLTYKYNNNTITIDNISAETTSYDFTVAYAADNSKGYPDNGTVVTVTPIVQGSVPMTATALADIYVESVSVNNGAALVAGDTYDSVLVMKNRGTAWVDISTSNFTATASTTDWNPTVTGTNKSMFLPDMVDTCSITYTGFEPATAGTYNINYEVNTKLQAAQEQQVHVITESNYTNNTKATAVTVLAEEPVIKVDSSKASVQGFQIRTNQGEDFDGRFDGSVAFRTVCKAPSIGAKFTARDGREYTVASIGIIYSIDENKTGDNSKMTIGPANTILNPQEVTPEKEAEKGYKYEGKSDNALITKGYVATPSAVLGSSGGYTTYAITMQGMDTQMANSMLVRSFIVATDGTFIYSTKVARVSVAEIADYMYYNSLCNNDNGHKYLYDTILNSSYTATSKYHRTQELEYGWNSTIYDKLPD